MGKDRGTIDHNIGERWRKNKRNYRGTIKELWRRNKDEKRLAQGKDRDKI